MTKRSKYILASIFLVLLGIGINFVFYVKEHYNERGQLSLINQYFRLKKDHPEDAVRVLKRILVIEPTNHFAMRELGYAYVRQGDTNSALKQFMLAHNAYPKDLAIALALGKLYVLTQQYNKAVILLDQAAKSTDLALKQQAQIALSEVPVKIIRSVREEEYAALTKATLNMVSLKSSISEPTVDIVKKLAETKEKEQVTAKNILSKVSERDTLFNQYYALKKTDPKKAWTVLQTILSKFPADLDALKEAGYTTLNAKEYASSYGYFLRAYEITKDPQLAMQIGYILINMNNNKLAYHYFNLAAESKDPKQILAAETAKMNLAQSLLKFLPEPYYADIFYDPFYYSRFKLMVETINLKLGREINKKYQFKVYLAYQRTVDDKSGFSQQLPVIFEDNAAITAIGAQFNPFPDVPLTIFGQAGKAVDLVYQNRSRWRNDVRGGLSYYKPWGEQPTYAIWPVISHHLVGDFYADALYFSRYRDIIGTFRLREGIRVFKYETSSIDLYLKGFLVWDTSHEFYNNIFEWGPGIAITPSNHYNVVLHLEALQGHYIPVNSPSPNPYSANYHNNLILLDVYFRI